MRTIDLEQWPRRKHFEVYSAIDYPHFGLCANIDITAFHAQVKQRQMSFTAPLVYLLARAANEIPEFRQRIRGNQVVEHATIHPSTTILGDSGLFGFCTIPYSPGFDEFYPRALAAIDRARKTLILENEPGKDDLLYMTSLPWVSFTGMMHPIHMHPADSVPRMAWGKYFHESERLRMPLSVQANHALMDGLHAGLFYQKVEAYLAQPESLFDT